MVSRDYGDVSNDLRKAIASLIKKICIEEIDDSSLSPLIASNLVSLNKNPGLRLIGVGKILRRVMGKVVMRVFSEDVTTASSDVQMCGRSSSSKAAIHAMRRTFQHENSDAVILVDAANALNNLNRKVLLHNIKFICPEIVTFLNSCYSVPTRLLVSGGLELTSREGSTQGDLLCMAIYAIAITPMLDMMLVVMQNDHNKIVGFADDVTASGNLEALRRWWDTLMQIAPYYGYYPQPTKSCLIAKENKLEEAVQVFGGTNIQVSTEGKQHLGAVTGTEENKKNYINNKISEWTKGISMLTDIVTVHPQAAYTAYVTSYQHKLVTNTSYQHTSYKLFPILGASLRRSVRLYGIN